MNMGGTGHTGIETADSTQDIDALIGLRAGEILQDWCVEYRFLVWAWIAPRVPRTGIPRRGGEDLVVRERAVVDSGVVGQVAAPSPPESGRSEEHTSELQSRG